MSWCPFTIYTLKRWSGCSTDTLQSSSLMPARGAMLAELFYLLRDKDDPGRFGAGLDPSPSMSNPSKGPVHDESTDMELAKFTERWIRDPRWI